MAAPIPDDPPRFPFLFATQYDRAPAPDPAAWDDDLRASADVPIPAGFGDILAIED